MLVKGATGVKCHLLIELTAGMAPVPPHLHQHITVASRTGNLWFVLLGHVEAADNNIFPWAGPTWANPNYDFTFLMKLDIVGYFAVPHVLKWSPSSWNRLCFNKYSTGELSYSSAQLGLLPDGFPLYTVRRSVVWHENIAANVKVFPVNEVKFYKCCISGMDVRLILRDLIWQDDAYIFKGKTDHILAFGWIMA